MRVPSGDITRYMYFVAVDPTDLQTRETGLSSFTVYRSRNGGVSTLWTTPTINETDVTNMPGVYELLIDEDTTIDAGDDEQEMVIHIIEGASQMEPVTRVIELYRPKITEGNVLGVAADGDISGNIDGNVDGSVATATALGVDAVDTISLADNAITNAKIAAGAIGTSELATSAVDKISDGVWDEDATDHQTQGTFGQAIGDPVLDTTTIYQSVATDATGDNVSIDVGTAQADLDILTGADGVNLLSATQASIDAIEADTEELQGDWVDAGRLDAILDARASQATADAIETDTQNIQSRIPAALGAGGQILADVTAIDGDAQAAVNLEALMDGVLIVVVNDAAAAVGAFAMDGFTEATDDHYIGRLMTFVTGALTGQQNAITDYDAAGHVQGAQTFIFSDPWTEAPANNDIAIVH